jgi:hypothetical protein
MYSRPSTNPDIDITTTVPFSGISPSLSSTLSVSTVNTGPTSFNTSLTPPPLVIPQSKLKTNTVASSLFSAVRTMPGISDRSIPPAAPSPDYIPPPPLVSSAPQTMAVLPVGTEAAAEHVDVGTGLDRPHTSGSGSSGRGEDDKSTPMSQSAHSHTTLALTWTLTPDSKF